MQPKTQKTVIKKYNEVYTTYLCLNKSHHVTWSSINSLLYVAVSKVLYKINLLKVMLRCKQLFSDWVRQENCFRSITFLPDGFLTVVIGQK